MCSNLYDYPELFDIDELNRVGFVSFGGKRGGELNLDGLSRDHKVSVSYAIKNKCDPYYITHPLNCELMPHKRNKKKHGECSITYDELVSTIKSYDTIHTNSV